MYICRSIISNFVCHFTYRFWSETNEFKALSEYSERVVSDWLAIVSVIHDRLLRPIGGGFPLIMWDIKGILLAKGVKQKANIGFNYSYKWVLIVSIDCFSRPFRWYGLWLAHFRPLILTILWNMIDVKAVGQRIASTLTFTDCVHISS